MPVRAVRDDLGFPSSGGVDRLGRAGRSNSLRPLTRFLSEGVRTSAIYVNVGQVAAGSMLLPEYTSPGSPTRQYTAGPYVLPPVKVGNRLDVIYYRATEATRRRQGPQPRSVGGLRPDPPTDRSLSVS
ncbi:hypothetical protein BN2537_8025 [Streptomyces venezuelae]|nr:hypothetical protein BN2537_8025 [Streptomyces venezuelae]